jgi:hypothetical protein
MRKIEVILIVLGLISATLWFLQIFSPEKQGRFQMMGVGESSTIVVLDTMVGDVKVFDSEIDKEPILDWKYQ